MRKQALQIARVIWKGLRRIVERIGRWTIRTIVRRGAYSLAGYLENRADAFRDRIKRIRKRKRHAQWRVDFLMGRIRRYLAASRWLLKRAPYLGVWSERNLAPYIDDLPENSPWENPRAWRRMVA